MYAYGTPGISWLPLQCAALNRQDILPLGSGSHTGRETKRMPVRPTGSARRHAGS